MRSCCRCQLLPSSCRRPCRPCRPSCWPRCRPRAWACPWVCPGCRPCACPCLQAGVARETAERVREAACADGQGAAVGSKAVAVAPNTLPPANLLNCWRTRRSSPGERCPPLPTWAASTCTSGGRRSKASLTALIGSSYHNIASPRACPAMQNSRRAALSRMVRKLCSRKPLLPIKPIRAVQRLPTEHRSTGFASRTAGVWVWSASVRGRRTTPSAAAGAGTGASSRLAHRGRRTFNMLLSGFP